MGEKKQLSDRDLRQIADFAAVMAGGDNQPSYTPEQEKDLWRQIGQKPDSSDGNGQSVQTDKRFELS